MLALLSFCQQVKLTIINSNTLAPKLFNHINTLLQTTIKNLKTLKMKGIVLVILIYIRDIPINCKMSKAMKTFHEGQKESFKKNNKLKIDFMELKQSLKTKYRSLNTGTCTVNEKMKDIFISDLTSQTEKLWVQLEVISLF